MIIIMMMVMMSRAVVDEEGPEVKFPKTGQGKVICRRETGGNIGGGGRGGGVRGGW